MAGRAHFILYVLLLQDESLQDSGAPKSRDMAGPSENPIFVLMQRKEVVDKTLEAKRETHAERMRACATRRLHAQKKREMVRFGALLQLETAVTCLRSILFQQLVEHMESFWPMLQASDVRRLRATKKADTENQEKASREKQIRTLQEELGSLQKR